MYNEIYLTQPLTNIDGNNITQVEYFITDAELKMNLYFTNTCSDSLDYITDNDYNALYRAMYRCQVVFDPGDGTVDLLPNPYNPLIANGFNRVPIVYPWPGMFFTLPTNAICNVMFANYDPQYPRVVSWEGHDNSAKPIARQSDPCGTLTFTFEPGMSGATAVLTYNGIAVTSGTTITITSGSSVAASN